SSQADGFQPLSDDGKKVDEKQRQESECKDQEKEDNVNSITNVNVAGTNKVNVVGANTNNELPFDPEIPGLEDMGTFNFLSDQDDDDDDDEEAGMNNMDTTIQVSPTLTIRIHKDHSLDQVIGDLHSTTQTKNMSKNFEEHGFVTTIHQRTNYKDLQNYLFACFLSQKEPKKVFQNKKDERGIVIRYKARLVAQGHKQEEGINYDEVFDPVARIKAIRLFLAYASFKDFMVYHMDVKSDFLYGKIKEEIQKKYGFSEVKKASTPIETQKPLLKDEDGKKVDVHMYRLMIGSLMYLTSLRPDIMFAMCACARYQVNPKVSHLYIVKMIFRKPRRKVTKVPQPSDPTSVADKTVNEEMDDTLERAATTATSLDAKQDNGDTVAQTRYERVSKISNDPLLVGVNTPQSEKEEVLCCKESRRKEEQTTNTSSTKKNNMYLPQEYERKEAH
nr:hypothetical protein [Tanacetum cinerariifolium]